MKKSAFQFLSAELKADIKAFKKRSDIIIEKARRFLKVAEVSAYFCINSLWAAANAHFAYLEMTHENQRVKGKL